MLKDIKKSLKLCEEFESALTEDSARNFLNKLPPDKKKTSFIAGTYLSRAFPSLSVSKALQLAGSTSGRNSVEEAEDKWMWRCEKGHTFSTAESKGEHAETGLQKCPKCGLYADLVPENEGLSTEIYFTKEGSKSSQGLSHKTYAELVEMEDELHNDPLAQEVLEKVRIELLRRDEIAGRQAKEQNEGIADSDSFAIGTKASPKRGPYQGVQGVVHSWEKENGKMTGKVWLKFTTKEGNPGMQPFYPSDLLELE